MKKILLVASVMAMLGVSVSMSVLAQPPAGEGRPDGPPRFEGGGPEGRRPPHPVMDVLDADKDGTLSAEEMNNATAALKTLDKNTDGKLSDDEIRPPRPEGGPGRGGEGGPDGPPRGDRPPGEDGPPGGGRPPGDGEGRPPGRGEAQPGRGEGQPGRGQGPQGRGEGPQGRPMGPPSPERFVEDAMRFDADADGKLNKEELMKFASEMSARQGRGPGQEGGRGQGRPEGDRPPGDRPPGGRGAGQEGDRPQRPPAEE